MLIFCFEDAVGDRGVDIICEMLASKNLKDDIPLLARNGRIIVSVNAIPFALINI